MPDKQSKLFAKLFEHTGGDWSGLNAAAGWLVDHGYSHGPLQRGFPIAIVKGNALVVKWTNLTQFERENADGVITPNGAMFRDSAAIVTLYDGGPADGE